MFRYVNRTDLVVIGACGLSLIVFSINTKLDSVIPLYFNSFIVLGIFTYWAIRKDGTGLLKRSLIIGGIGGFFYTFVDSIFVNSWIYRYLRLEDIDIFAAPASIVLVWIYCVAIAIYLYQRLRSVFSKFYIPSVLTGASAFLSGIVFHYLGKQARLWEWNDVWVSSSPSVGSTPLFVPVALFVTFFLSPYIVGGQRISTRIRLSDNPIAGGLRCAVILAMTMYILFRIFTG
jgi:hypothetical protein